MRTIKELIKAMGGYEQCASKTQRSVSTVTKWPARGIPEEVWDDFIKHAGTNAHELHLANRQAWAGENLPGGIGTGRPAAS